MSYLNYKNKGLVKKARQIRNNMTKPEIILWSRIMSKKIQGIKFRRQQPILNYIVDFYNHELKLIIEIDGEIHDNSEIAINDMDRENDLISHGFNVLRFKNYEIETELSRVLQKINSVISEELLKK